MLGRVAGQVFDLLVAPQISKFVLTGALRMSEADLLRGSAAAANAVSSALVAKQLHGDPDPLAELARSGSLHPRLASTLLDETCDRVVAPEAHLRAGHLQAAPTLDRTRLIVGARRSTYVGSNRAVRNYRCTLGSHLVVVADHPHDLWKGQKHRELLAEEGCTVQCVVGFKSDELSSPPLQYVLEAEVRGETLLEPDDETEDLSFSVVDMNNALSSNAFWADAKEVPGWQRLFMAT
mmetsp:Transcript_24228/g.49208  ORF Transcript_24228/g.49208 Transcript_24228/m.49208 type:complete len:236 (+) Transcript_24228:54-761(+)